jgi:hypothetical protein
MSVPGLGAAKPRTAKLGASSNAAMPKKAGPVASVRGLVQPVSGGARPGAVQAINVNEMPKSATASAAKPSALPGGEPLAAAQPKPVVSKKGGSLNRRR